MYFWRVSSFVEAQAVIALLWLDLGSVKRTQAARAMRAVHGQYAAGLYRPRRPRSRGRCYSLHTTRPWPAADPEQLDLAWASGFLDAEGCFSSPRSVHRKDGSSWLRLRVSASQHGALGHPAETLLKLQRILGGRVECHGEPDDHRWVVERAEDVQRILARVRVWLGTVKQHQAATAIGRSRDQTRLHGDKERCIRGHAYDHVYVSRTGPKRRCNACARILYRSSRARKGIKPRRFTNASRRYTC